MIRPRLIPCLLIQNGGLVKTTKFDNPKYIGDPINAVKIFNEKNVDELIVFDIDATVRGIEPNLELIANLATECRMPLCYGGGISNVEQIKKIIDLGVEKVSISSTAIENPKIITEAVHFVGSQSIVVTLDTKKINDNFFVFSYNGKNNSKINLFELVNQIQKLGAGEIVINSIDDDGLMKGYNIELIKKVVEMSQIPITAVGGAGSLDDVKNLFNTFGLIGACAGSLFVFKGVYRAVLINYPGEKEKLQLYTNNQS
tara:strand:- start:2680 stop:3450 length:771 start_codon:yes stop_codon:yes gene_type:complete